MSDVIVANSDGDGAVMFKNLSSIKWTVERPGCVNQVRRSARFTIQGCECSFKLYFDGDFGGLYDRRMRLDIRSHRGMFSPPIAVTVLVSSTSNTFSYRRCFIKGDLEKIWTYASSLIPDNLLAIEMILHVDLLKKDKTIQTVSYLTDDMSMKSLSEDFSKFLDTGLYHDVELKCGQHTFKAHKIVLSARSEVFKAMLETDMQESRTGIVLIQEVDVNYFQDFIRYLYTALIPELSFEKAKSLYEVGDKYAVRSLMHQCSEYLQENLSSENAFECLVLADAHSDLKLVDGIITYLVDKKLYLQEEYWAPFCDSFPKIAIKVHTLSHKKSEGHCEKKMKVF